MVVYYEETPPEFIENPACEFRDLFHDEQLLSVLRWCKANPVLQGRMPSGYSYNFDIFKFCRKVFALADAALREKDLVFWLDADSRLLKPITTEFLEGLLADVYCGFMGRKGYHIESSIVGVDTRHEINERFMQRYRQLYETGEILWVKGWHDCWAFMSVCAQLNVQTRNWTPDAEGTCDPIKLGPWAGMVTHLKGPRKHK